MTVIERHPPARHRTIFLSDIHLGTRGCQAELPAMARTLPTPSRCRNPAAKPDMPWLHTPRNEPLAGQVLTGVTSGAGATVRGGWGQCAVTTSVAWSGRSREEGPT